MLQISNEDIHPFSPRQWRQPDLHQADHGHHQSDLCRHRGLPAAEGQTVVGTKVPKVYNYNDRTLYLMEIVFGVKLYSFQLSRICFLWLNSHVQLWFGWNLYGSKFKKVSSLPKPSVTRVGLSRAKIQLLRRCNNSPFILDRLNYFSPLFWVNPAFSPPCGRLPKE